MFCNIDIDLTAKAMGAWIALGGFLFGVYQYYKAQRWKKAEFAAKELDKLIDDQVLSLACVFLDWEGRTLNTPDSYKEKAGSPVFIHSWKVMENAMVGALEPPDGRGGFFWQEVLYRDVFDRFFSYLDMLNHYLNIGLIEQKDISAIRYWLEQISGSRLANEKPVFNDFLVFFGYKGVIELFHKFSIGTPDK
jgi:hypothetical protein